MREMMGKECEQALLDLWITIVCEWSTLLNLHDIDCLYGYVQDREFYPLLRNTLLNKKIIYYVVYSSFTHDAFEELIWTINQNIADKESFRYTYWLSLGENSIHCSKKQYIIKEIQHFLSDSDFQTVVTMMGKWIWMYENTIILHGWSTSAYCESNRDFYHTIFSDYVEGEDTILYIPFAWYNQDWNVNRLSNNLEKFVWRRYNIIVWETAILDKQILEAKYVYINGWDYKKLWSYCGYL